MSHLEQCESQTLAKRIISRPIQKLGSRDLDVPPNPIRDAPLSWPPQNWCRTPAPLGNVDLGKAPSGSVGIMEYQYRPKTVGVPYMSICLTSVFCVFQRKRGRCSAKLAYGGWWLGFLVSGVKL